MAKIGLSKPYFAIYTATDAGVVSYSDFMVLGKATQFSMELEGSDTNILYADNGPAESENEFSGGTITIGTDDLSPDAVAKLLGTTAQTVTNTSITTKDAKEIIFGESQVIPYVGFGVIVKKKIAGATKWMPVVYPKVQFANPGLSATTQGETIEWQTPELSGTIMREDSSAHGWCRYALLDSEADAFTYIKSIIGGAA